MDILHNKKNGSLYQDCLFVYVINEKYDDVLTDLIGWVITETWDPAWVCKVSILLMTSTDWIYTKAYNWAFLSAYTFSSIIHFGTLWVTVANFM